MAQDTTYAAKPGEGLAAAETANYPVTASAASSGSDGEIISFCTWRVFTVYSEDAAQPSSPPLPP